MFRSPTSSLLALALMGSAAAQTGSYTLIDNRSGAPDGNDTVVNVENFQFSDGTLTAAEILNDAPTDISISASSVDENSAAGTVVGTLGNTDADTLDRANRHVGFDVDHLGQRRCALACFHQRQIPQTRPPLRVGSGCRNLYPDDVAYNVDNAGMRDEH